MILRVIFPHEDEQGNRFNAGDLRAVPDHQVEHYTAPHIAFNHPVMALDKTIDQETAQTSVTEFEAPEPTEDEVALQTRLQAEAEAEFLAARKLLEEARAQAEAAARAEADAEVQRQAEAEKAAAETKAFQEAEAKATADKKAAADAEKAAKKAAEKNA